MRLLLSIMTALMAVASLSATDAVAQSVTTDAGTISVEGTAPLFKAPGYSPFAGRNFPTRVFWGNQHLHTSWSGDAAAGGTSVGPEEALRLAQGEEISSSTGQQVKLSRPLDWLAVSDHSDALGMFQSIIAGDPDLMRDPVLKQWNLGTNAGGQEAMAVAMDVISRQSNGTLPEAVTDAQSAFDMWHKMTEIVEGSNDPGRFTAFIAYEWTSNAGGGDNLHRNVIYRDGKDKADRVAPMTTFDSENPEKLWEWMAGYEAATGGRVLAIPHNGNLSNGRMFALNTFEGDPLTVGWAESRQRWEPLYEVTQGKGTSEAHPALAPADEFADFEIWDKGNLNVVPKQPGMIELEYVRDALKNGLAVEADLGANPFKYGMAGGTDAHTGITSTEENNFFGKFPTSEPSAERWSENAFDFDGRTIKGWELGASGLTAVWATENTRAALWDAMKGRETYATTGTRILVRFFGGWDLVPEDALGRNPGAVGYEKGVPMGGQLDVLPDGQAPSFLVAALKDPLSGNLDRIQIVKGWLDVEGRTQEKIYDVAWGDADTRQPDADGKVPPVGNTVDIPNGATPSAPATRTRAPTTSLFISTAPAC